MVNLLISAEQFNGEEGVDTFLDYVRLLSAVEKTNPFDLVEVLENDDGDILCVLDFHGFDVLVNSLMYQVYSNDIGAFSFPEGMLTYGLVDMEAGIPFYFGTFFKADALEEDTCDCPPGECLADFQRPFWSSSNPFPDLMFLDEGASFPGLTSLYDQEKD